MSSRPEKIREFWEQTELARTLYNLLDTCPEQQRPEIRKQIGEVDAKLWELFSELENTAFPDIDPTANEQPIIVDREENRSLPPGSNRLPNSR